MKIYCLSGFGADHRVFRKLQLNNHELIHINWIPPKAKESLKSYASRLAEQIPAEEKSCLLGISFGGMLATEIAKKRQFHHVILLSTIMTRREMRLIYRVLGKAGLYHLLPLQWLKKYHRIDNYFFGLQHRSDIKLFKKVLLDTDFNFLKWGVEAMLKWENNQSIHCTRIHGTKDKIIPAGKLTQVNYFIEGGHLLPLTHPKQIEGILDKELR